MKAGETKRFDCESCMTEFEVCVEPKAKGRESVEEMGEKPVDFCPLCGSQKIVCQDDGEEADRVGDRAEREMGTPEAGDGSTEQVRGQVNPDEESKPKGNPRNYGEDEESVQEAAERGFESVQDPKKVAEKKAKKAKTSTEKKSAPPKKGGRKR